MGKSTSKLERGLLAIAMVLAVAFRSATRALSAPPRPGCARPSTPDDPDNDDVPDGYPRRHPGVRRDRPVQSRSSSPTRAVISIAEELAPWSALPPRITVDTDALRDRTHSFFASGLTDNHCTAMYLRDDQAPLFSIASEGIETIVTLADGHVVKNSSSREFAVIVRYSPDPRRQPGRRWFLVAGLDEVGSAAAGHYLAQHWQDLSAIVSDWHDFVAVVGLPLHAWWEPTLTHVVSRDRAGAIITIEIEVAPSIR